MLNKFAILAILCVITFTVVGQTPHPYYGGGKHTNSHGGTYVGGKGSSHKGGHYKNAKTRNTYGRH